MNLRSPASLQRGLTLIELMVAMVLGILVAGGIITVFLSTSASNKAQTQMATLQEAGRYAMTRLRGDIGMANALYCSGSGGKPDATAGGGPSLDQLRSPTVFAPALLLGALSDVTTGWGASGYPAQPTGVFALPEYLYMRGYDCDTSSCTPLDPSVISGIPAQGTAVGDRVVGSSILTVRYLDSSAGWHVGRPGGTSLASNAGALQQINLVQQSGEPDPTAFGSGDLAMLADCSAAQVFAVSGQGTNVLAPLPSPANVGSPGAWIGATDLKLFDFNQAFRTVTYFLTVVDAGNGHTTGALIRRENGQNQELVRGIERLNFRYGVMQSDGQTRFLTAQQVEAQSSAANCPPSAPSPGGGAALSSTGCLWRAVKSIEVDLLMDGQTPLYTLGNAELAYTYASDGINTPQPPGSHAIDPEADQGFPRSLLRREFTALIAVRNYNP